jgi:hypothetical protein
VAIVACWCEQKYLLLCERKKMKKFGNVATFFWNDVIVRRDCMFSYTFHRDSTVQQQNQQSPSLGIGGSKINIHSSLVSSKERETYMIDLPLGHELLPLVLELSYFLAPPGCGDAVYSNIGISKPLLSADIEPPKACVRLWLPWHQRVVLGIVPLEPDFQNASISVLDLVKQLNFNEFQWKRKYHWTRKQSLFSCLFPGSNEQWALWVTKCMSPLLDVMKRAEDEDEVDFDVIPCAYEVELRAVLEWCRSAEGSLVLEQIQLLSLFISTHVWMEEERNNARNGFVGIHESWFSCWTDLLNSCDEKMCSNADGDKTQGTPGLITKKEDDQGCPSCRILVLLSALSHVLPSPSDGLIKSSDTSTANVMIGSVATELNDEQHATLRTEFLRRISEPMPETAMSEPILTQSLMSQKTLSTVYQHPENNTVDATKTTKNRATVVIDDEKNNEDQEPIFINIISDNDENQENPKMKIPLEAQPSIGIANDATKRSDATISMDEGTNHTAVTTSEITEITAVSKSSWSPVPSPRLLVRKNNANVSRMVVDLDYDTNNNTDNHATRDSHSVDLEMGDAQLPVPNLALEERLAMEKMHARLFGDTPSTTISRRQAKIVVAMENMKAKGTALVTTTRTTGKGNEYRRSSRINKIRSKPY